MFIMELSQSRIRQRTQTFASFIPDVFGEVAFLFVAIFLRDLNFHAHRMAVRLSEKHRKPSSKRTKAQVAGMLSAWILAVALCSFAAPDVKTGGLLYGSRCGRLLWLILCLRCSWHHDHLDSR